MGIQFPPGWCLIEGLISDMNTCYSWAVIPERTSCIRMPSLENWLLDCCSSFLISLRRKLARANLSWWISKRSPYLQAILLFAEVHFQGIPDVERVGFQTSGIPLAKNFWPNVSIIAAEFNALISAVISFFEFITNPRNVLLAWLHPFSRINNEMLQMLLAEIVFQAVTLVGSNSFLLIYIYIFWNL